MSEFENKNFILKKNVKNIYNEFFKNDLLICGGGMTPFEAASTGLPSIVIATEKFEKFCFYEIMIEIFYFCSKKVRFF